MAAIHQRAVLAAATLSLCFGGSLSALERVDFQVAGTDAGLAAELRASSALLALQKSKDVTALDLFADARADYGKLIDTLYAHGYYGPVIHILIDGREAAGIAPLDAPSAISRIEVTVDPGPVFAFSKATIAPLAPRTDVPEGFAAGKVAESGVILDAVQAGVDGWRTLGQAKARVAGQNLQADHRTSTLSAEVALEPGPVLRFGPMTVNGLARLTEYRFRKIAGVPTGQRFDPADEARVAARLRRTGVFSSVSLTEDDAVIAPDLLGLTADVVEAKPRRYTFGAEIASYDGAVLTGSWLHRNLLGGAERLEVTGQISDIAAQNSGVDYVLGVTLDRPATPGPDTTLNLATTLTHKNDVDYRANIGAVSGGFTHYFSDTLTAHAALGYNFSTGHDLAGDFTYRSLQVPLGVTWDRRDSKIDATRLFYVDANLKPFFGFGGTENGVRLGFDARGYKTLGGGGKVVLAARLQGGAVLGASLLGTPREDLFYSGGAGTVRGQPYQSLGAVANDGGVQVNVGGNRFVATSLEARVKVASRVSVVGFVDVGLVGAGGFSAANSDWQAGAGLGLRYDTGVGPIRLDLAVPVHGTGTGVQAYVGLGQAF